MQGDGATLRVHLQRAAEVGKVDDRLFNECPRPLLPLWTAYQQIARSRPVGMGVSGISLQEVESWQRLYGVQFTPWELDTIIELDAAFIRRIAARKG